MVAMVPPLLLLVVFAWEKKGGGKNMEGEKKEGKKIKFLKQYGGVQWQRGPSI
jgi:hypothetical protein